MLDTDFFNPTGQLLADTQARLDAVSKPAETAATLAAQSAQSTPQPAPAPPAVDLVRTFEDAANQYGVPVDALLAMAEKDSGFDHLSRSRGPGPKSRGIIRMSDADMVRGVNPYDASHAIGAAAQKLRSYMDGGASIDDALRAHGGGGEAGEAYRIDIAQRAKRLADTLYPEEAPVDPAAHNILPSDAKTPAESPGVIGTVKDLALTVKSGFDMAAMDLEGVAAKILPERVMKAISDADKFVAGKTTKEIFEQNRKDVEAAYSPKMRESLAKKWWNQDKGEFGDAFSDWRAYAGAVLQSLPESVATSGPALKLAKGAYAINIARGATPAVAASRAATVATVAGAVTEGALGGAQSEREVKEEIEKLPIATLRQSDAFKTMVAQGMSEDAARHALARDMGVRAFVTGGIATGIFGGMGDRIIAKSFLGRAAGSGWKDTAKRLGGAALGEGLAEELPQSVLQQVAQNEAVRHADPNKSLMDDVINQGLGGAVAGGIMGAGMGGAFHRATRDTEQAAAPATPPAAPPAAATPPGAQSGPLGRALDAGAPHLSEVAKPAGGAVVVTDEVGTLAGHVVAQDKDGVTVQSADGQTFLYSPSDISSGAVKIEAAPAAETVSAAPAAQPAAALAQPEATAAAPSEDPKTGFWVKRLEAGDANRVSYALMRGEDHVGMAGLTLDQFDEKGRPTGAYIESIGGRDYTAADGSGWQSGVNSLGPRAILALRRQFQADFPTVATLNAERASGARFGGDYERSISDQKPMQVHLRAENAGKSATTDTAPVAREGDTASFTTGAPTVAPEPDAGNATPAGEIALADMGEPALRVKLKTLAVQAKTAGGWTADAKAARREIEAEIGKRQRDAAPEAVAPAIPARADADRAVAASVAAPNTAPAPVARASAVQRTRDYAPAAVTPVKPETVAKTDARKPARVSPKTAAVEHDAAIKDYFTPGNIVRAYGGHDRVIGFERDAAGHTVVTVEAVKRVAGEWETVGEPRRHSTMPDRRSLAQGPVERVATAKKSFAASAPARGMSKTELSDHLTAGQDGDVLARLIEAGDVVLHDTAETLPDEATHASGAVQGVVTPDGKIHLVASNLTPETARGALLHEVFHAGTESLIGAPAMRQALREIAALAKRARERIAAGKPSRADSFWVMAMRRAEQAGTPEAHMTEEIAAYAVERAESAPAGLRALADRIVGAVKAWALTRFGRQLGDVTPEQLRSLAVAALRSWRDKPHATHVAGVRYSLAAAPKADASAAPAAPKSPIAPRSLFDRAREEASTFLTAMMVGTKGSAETVGKYSLLSLTPTRALFNELAKPMPSARTYLQTKEAMDALRNQRTDAASAILDTWEKFARKKENRAANKALMDIMHRSTLEQVDPSKPFEAFWTSDDQAALVRTKRGTDQWDALAARKAEDSERRKTWEAMQAEFKALPAEAQRLYGEVRDAYKEMADAGEAQVVKNIQTALDHLVTKAEREHADEMQRIRDDGLTGGERDAAEKAADDKFAKVKARTVRNRAARVKNMRAEFESNRIKGPYFPLSRFGNYFVTVRDANGKVVSFSRFESARQQRRFATEQRAAGLAVEEGVASAKSALERNLDPKFVAEVESILEGADAPDSVRDAIWQKYLETLPDFSARKSRLHRKGRAGFATDAMRAFAHNMFHGSHQLARLTYGQDLQSLIEGIRREARNAPDPVRAGAVANEIVRAHDFTMSPKASPWALRASSFAFLWTMGANLSSAIVNLDQAWTKGIPNLAYDEETKAGVRAAARETAKALRDFVVGRGSAENASTLTDEERAALSAGYDSGLIDKTQAHDVAGVAEAGLDYNPIRHKAMKLASAPMHHTERLNREVTFLASYRIARAAGLDHERAIRKAADLTWMTHFDNQSSSKPRFMRGDAGRTMFALKAFQANILFRLFRDMHQSLHGATPDERRMAFGRMASTMALTAAAAGVRGAYFYGVLMMIAGAFMGLAGEDDDPEEKLRKIVLEAAGDSMIGQAVGGMLLDGIPGYLTGTALSERLGMGDLWLRTPQRDMKSEQAFAYIVDQIGGAPLSLAHNVFLGAAEAGKGNVARGVEKAAPAVVRNAMKAARYAREGVKDKSGDDVVDNVPLRDVLKQAIGFTPAAIADRYARNTFQQNTQDRIAAERRAALQAAARAERAGDDDAYDRAMEKVDAFNERYSDHEITPANIRQSRNGMDRTTDAKEFGVKLHKGLEDFIKEKTAPSIYSR